MSKSKQISECDVAQRRQPVSKIDYRLCNDYWNKRIMFREYDRLIITKGYPKRDDSSRRIDVPYGGYEIKTITHPHFGDKPVKVFAIKVNIGNE
ncbi:ASCH domain-containing protein [Escherichia coli]|nr:ASCH domain-containing protein [Escherichia coli]NVF69380.1 ASCH domain-containing protein [Escherichia coli]